MNRLSALVIGFLLAVSISRAGALSITVVEYTTSGCVPCKSMEPRVASLYRKGYPITIYDSPEVAARSGVYSFPTFVIRHCSDDPKLADREIARRSGECTEFELAAWIDQYRNQESYTEPPKVQRRSDVPPFVCRVRTKAGNGWYLGSGTLIEVGANYGLIATAAHTLENGSDSLEVAFPTGTIMQAAVLDLDRPHDLAILRIASPGIRPASLGDDPAIGEVLTSAGYGGEGHYLANHGTLDSYGAVDRVQGFFSLTGPARHGDSGGPVLNGRGELVGVVQSTSLPQDPNKMVTACSCRPLRDLLDRVRNRFRGGQASPQAPPRGILNPSRPSSGSGMMPDVPPVGSVPMTPLPDAAPGLVDVPPKPAPAVSPTPQQQVTPDMGGEAPKWSDLTPPNRTTDPIPPAVEKAAESIGTGLLTKGLTYLGLASGPAGLIAAGAMWLLSRGAKKRLADENSKLHDVVTSLKSRIDSLGPQTSTPVSTVAPQPTSPQTSTMQPIVPAGSNAWNGTGDSFTQQLADKNTAEGMSVPQEAYLARLFKEALQELSKGTQGSFGALNGRQLAAAIETSVLKKFLSRFGVTTSLGGS